MAQGKVLRLLDGRPIDADHFRIFDENLPLRLEDRMAIVRAERALDRTGRFAIAAATRRRLLGSVVADTALEAAQEIAKTVKETYGNEHKSTAIALVATFYTYAGMTTLHGTNARVLLADAEYSPDDPTPEGTAFEYWTKRLAKTEIEGTREVLHHRNRRILIHRPFQLLGVKAKRGPRE
ncbi:MAG TPA: hypothetical protein VHC20_08035 [Candidatus Paceibacterota bacterium]|nr:hypothetical protein [Candidatus Paceibacterota bacterium]